MEGDRREETRQQGGEERSAGKGDKAETEGGQKRHPEKLKER